MQICICLAAKGVTVNRQKKKIYRMQRRVPVCSCLRPLSLSIAGVTPLKENSYSNVLNFSGISPICSSTPLSTQKYVSITPKSQTGAIDEGYVSFKSPNDINLNSKSSFHQAFQSNEKSINKGISNIEHGYFQQETHLSPKKKTTKKLIVAPEVLKKIVKNVNNPTSDLLSNSECALIQSSLPLRSRKEFAKTVLGVPSLKRAVKDSLLSELSQDNVVLRSRKHGKVSQLMKKDFTDLKNFKWEDIVGELREEFLFLAEVLIAVIIPQKSSEMNRNERLASVLPRIGMVYAILAQARNPELSKVQRCMSMLLFDTICDQKVFNRLHILGMCFSYEHSLRLLDYFGGSFNTSVIDAIRKGKKIRIVGDNINWRTGVHDERRDKHEHMNHAFGSAVIIQNVSFSNLSRISPQNHYKQLTVHDFLLSADEWVSVRAEYAVLISRVIGRHIPSLAFMKDHFPKFITSPYSEQLKEPNKVIPLPVLYLNEQKYDDVVQIMEYYEKYLDDVYNEAGVPKPKVHTGGDQLTRERFSGGKRLRAGGVTAEERFDHLSPITFELFHLMMNYVSLMFKQLYKTKSETDIGTMRCEQNRILRTKVNENVNEYYDADKDFITSFVDAYIVEAVLDYFGMDDVNAVPQQNIPPPDLGNTSDWSKKQLGLIVDRYVGKSSAISDNNSVEEDGCVVAVQLGNGARKTLTLKKLKKPVKEDGVKNYGHLVLELGLLFKALLDLCKNPYRERGLRLLKIAMVHFKANNYLSKYAYEIMRFLVHQQSILSEKEAHEEFYGLFVNTKGGLDRHIPCDLRMEFLVKEIKRNIKHMFSNKTENNITVRTSALPALSDIGENFDKCSNVRVRAKKHSDIDSKKDERDIIQDLRQVKPFQLKAGRFHESFPNISKTIVAKLDPAVLHKWILQQNVKFATEIGV